MTMSKTTEDRRTEAESASTPSRCPWRLGVLHGCRSPRNRLPLDFEDAKNHRRGIFARVPAMHSLNPRRGHRGRHDDRFPASVPRIRNQRRKSREYGVYPQASRSLCAAKQLDSLGWLPEWRDNLWTARSRIQSYR